MSKHVSIAGALSLIASASIAAESGSLIDEQMADQIDFRQTSFSVCFEQNTCEVNVLLPPTDTAEAVELTLAIAAERSGGLLDAWQPAQIYWDPVDGFGVMGGGQNDEIDFDERLTVSIEGGATLGGLWFSDMFIYEQTNYGASYSVQDDLEAADVVGFLNGEQVLENRITGEVALPDAPFNALLGNVFQEEGDLLNRLLIEEGEVSVLIRDPNGEDPDRIIRAAIGNIDPTKLDIFDGVEVIDIDAATLLGDAEFAPLLAVGDANATRLKEMLTDEVQLVSLQTQAEGHRLVSDIPNGEVGVAMREPAQIDMLSFTAEMSTSNDYSVVGLVVAR